MMQGLGFRQNFVQNNFYSIVFFIISCICISFCAYLDYANKSNANGVVIIGIFITCIAALAGLLNMIFAAKESVLNYYFSLVCVSSWMIYVVFYSPLIWDASINIGYLMLDAYGLYYWLHGKNSVNANHKVIATRHLQKLEYVVYSIIGILLIYTMTIIGIQFGRYSSGLQALTDSFTTVLAILAKYLTARKVLQSWHLWILVSIISIPLYLSIGSHTLAMAWFLYLLNSFYGLYMWSKKMKFIKQINY